MADLGAVAITRRGARVSRVITPTAYLWRRSFNRFFSVANHDPIPVWKPAPYRAGSKFISKSAPSWAASSLFDINTPTHARIGGTVMQQGTPIPYAEVRLYWRETGALIQRTRSDALGAFEFKYLIDAPTAFYTLVALDPVGGDNQNALVFDKLQSYTPT